jgi:phenylalanyl-tRNA synthetase beta chain
MICALYELGLEEKTDEAYARGIEELDSDAKVGSDPLVYLGLGETLYELDIHKHRNNDCYYHIGFAYEIGAILNRKVTLPENKYSEISESALDLVKLSVETEKCPYYTAKIVKNVKVGESPDFIKKRLNSLGMRSINNVVDISNYVMLEYGQPLHFFDRKKLGNNILVRDAKDGEEIVTLDDEARKLSHNDIVITDGVKPVAIAGVMGGKNTEVDDDTTEILIEAAIFDPVSIRYTARNHDLRSEASIRFGKGLTYQYTDMAMDRACYLLEKYAKAEILSGKLNVETLFLCEGKIIVQNKILIHYV